MHRLSAGGGHRGGSDGRGGGGAKGGGSSRAHGLSPSQLLVSLRLRRQNHTRVGLCCRLTHLVTRWTFFLLFLKKICWTFFPITLTHIHLRSTQIRKRGRRTAPPPIPWLRASPAFSVLGGKDFTSHCFHVTQDFSQVSFRLIWNICTPLKVFITWVM